MNKEIKLLLMSTLLGVVVQTTLIKGMNVENQHKQDELFFELMEITGAQAPIEFQLDKLAHELLPIACKLFPNFDTVGQSDLSEEHEGDMDLRTIVDHLGELHVLAVPKKAKTIKGCSRKPEFPAALQSTIQKKQKKEPFIKKREQLKRKCRTKFVVK